MNTQQTTTPQKGLGCLNLIIMIVGGISVLLALSVLINL
jgi:hypothetical protein